MTGTPAVPAMLTAAALGGPVYAAPLTTQPLPGTLLDAAEVIVGDGPWQIGGVGADFDACVVAHPGTHPCDPRVDKVVDQMTGWATADPFTIYALYGCKTVGVDHQKAPEAAGRALERSQAVAVERGMLEQVLAPRAVLVNDDTNPPELGIALLEGFLAARYGGLGVLHMPRSVVAEMAAPMKFDRTGGKITTFLGTPVAAGGGYEEQTLADGTPITPVGGTTAQDDEVWLYATGACRVHLSQTHTYPVTYDLPRNDFAALAERTAAVIADCLVAAVRVGGCC